MAEVRSHSLGTVGFTPANPQTQVIKEKKDRISLNVPEKPATDKTEELGKTLAKPLEARKDLPALPNISLKPAPGSTRLENVGRTTLVNGGPQVAGRDMPNLPVVPQKSAPPPKQEAAQAPSPNSQRNLQLADLILNSSIKLITDKGFSKGEYAENANTYNKVADECKTMGDRIQSDRSLGDQNAIVNSLRKNEAALHGAADNIDSKARKLSEESQRMLSSVGSKITAQSLKDQSDKCADMAENKMISDQMRSNLRNTAMALAEKGASIKVEKGKIDEAFQVRANVVNKLGAHSLKSDLELKKALENKSYSKHGTYVSDRSSRTIRGGNINIDHRVIRNQDGSEKSVVAIRTTLNYHIHKHLFDSTIKADPKVVVKGVESALKEFKGKVSVNTESHLVLPKAQDIDEKNQAQAKKVFAVGTEREIEVTNSLKKQEKKVVSDTGMVLGRTWTLEIDGIGKLSVPVVDYSEKYTELVPSPGILNGEGKGRAPCNTTVMQNVYLEMNGSLSAEDQVKYSEAMMTMVGMGPVFEKDATSDLDKMKMLDAFRAFYPREALALQLKESTYNMTAEELQAEIKKSLPNLPEYYQKTLDSLEHVQGVQSQLNLAKRNTAEAQAAEGKARSEMSPKAIAVLEQRQEAAGNSRKAELAFNAAKEQEFLTKTAASKAKELANTARGAADAAKNSPGVARLEQAAKLAEARVLTTENAVIEAGRVVSSSDAAFKSAKESAAEANKAYNELPYAKVVKTYEDAVSAETTLENTYNRAVEASNMTVDAYEAAKFANEGFNKALEGGVQAIKTADGRKVNGVDRASVIQEACKAVGNPILGLMAGVGGTPRDEDGNLRPLSERNIDIAYKILSGGFLSTEARLNAGLVFNGDSPGADMASGGGNYVYFRAVNQAIADKHTLDTFRLAGTFQMIISLKALNDDPHASAATEDNFGENDPMNLTRTKTTPTLKQPSMTEFFTNLTENEKDNEVMVTGTSKPEHILGMVVRNQIDKDAMKAGLQKRNDEGVAKGLAPIIKDGRINGVLLDDFIHIPDEKSNKFTAKMFNV